MGASSSDGERADEGLPEAPLRSDYGRGCYRRCIVLEARDSEVHGELADDFHHFAVTLGHDGLRAVRVAGEDVRVPWTTCPGAVAPLRRMEGAPLSRSLPDLLRHTTAREQCTHLHDLACLAIAHAARAVAGGAARRRYDAEIPDRVGGRARVALVRDGEPRLDWRIESSTIVAAKPAAFEGMRLRGTAFHRFLRREADLDLAEAAWVLQRAVYIGMGRQHDFEAIHEARAFEPVVGAACHTFDPARVGAAKRVHGSLRDFTGTPERILDRDGPGVSSAPSAVAHRTG